MCPRIVDTGLRTIEEKLRAIGFYSKNRYEWCIADCAAAISNITSVTLYDTLGAEAMEAMLEETQLRAIVCSAEHVESFLKFAKKSQLQHLIYFDHLSQNVLDEVAAAGLKITRFEDAIKEGQEQLGDNDDFCDVAPKPESIFTVCYTSGSTGRAKGALLPNRGFLASASNIDLFDANF